MPRRKPDREVVGEDPALSRLIAQHNHRLGQHVVPPPAAVRPAAHPAEARHQSTPIRNQPPIGRLIFTRRLAIPEEEYRGILAELEEAMQRASKGSRIFTARTIGSMLLSNDQLWSLRKVPRLASSSIDELEKKLREVFAAEIFKPSHTQVTGNGIVKQTHGHLVVVNIQGAPGDAEHIATSTEALMGKALRPTSQAMTLGTIPPPLSVGDKEIIQAIVSHHFPTDSEVPLQGAALVSM